MLPDADPKEDQKVYQKPAILEEEDLHPELLQSCASATGQPACSPFFEGDGGGS